jgi:hypothetical protein
VCVCVCEESLVWRGGILCVWEESFVCEEYREHFGTTTCSCVYYHF